MQSSLPLSSPLLRMHWPWKQLELKNLEIDKKPDYFQCVHARGPKAIYKAGTEAAYIALVPISDLWPSRSSSGPPEQATIKRNLANVVLDYKSAATTY